VQLAVAYTTPLQGVVVASDLTTDLDGNPDWNEAVSPGGTAAWDCNLLNNAASAPRPASPALLVCETTNLQDQAFAGTEHLATIRFQTGDAGTAELIWTGDTSLLSGADEVLCGSGIACIGAEISVGTDAVGAPAPTSTPLPELCGLGDPARWVHLAQSDDRQIIALASPLTTHDYKAGIELRIDHVIEGAFAEKQAIADVEPLFPCRVEQVWSAGVPVAAVFLLGTERADLFTVMGWPLTDASGIPLGSEALASDTVDLASVRVKLESDVLLTIDGLLALGEAYVEPTPTPLPPGLSPPPPAPPADAGDGIVAPSTGGDGPVASGEGSDDAAVWFAAIGGVAALAVFAGGWWAYRRRRSDPRR
jgi:hypothetical protein